MMRSLLTIISLLLLLVDECSSLAGRGQRRRSRAPAAVEYNSATATALDFDDQKDLDILWGMAGQTSRRRQRSGRKVVRPKDIKKESLEPTITEEDIQSVTIDSPLQATISLVNGTTYTANPRDLDQRRDFAVWMKARQELDISASELSALVNNSYFSTRDQLLQKKAGLLQPSFVGNSKACQWGLKMEPQALKQYRQVTGNEVEETGLWIQPQDQLLLGASPDGLVQDYDTSTSGLLEIKSLWGRRHKKALPEFDHCPRRFWDQIQGQLAVADREWCDLMLYIPPTNKHLKNYCIVRVERDREYWDTVLFPAVQSFCQDVRELKEKESG